MERAVEEAEAEREEEESQAQRKAAAEVEGRATPDMLRGGALNQSDVSDGEPEPAAPARVGGVAMEEFTLYQAAGDGNLAASPAEVPSYGAGEPNQGCIQGPGEAWLNGAASSAPVVIPSGPQICRQVWLNNAAERRRTQREER